MMNLELNLSQKQILSQRMQLSVRILQMNALDLEQYIQDAALENPLIELEIPQESEDPGIQRLKKLEWLDSVDESNSFLHNMNMHSRGPDSDTQDQPLYEKNAGQSLSDDLLLQLPGFALPSETERILRYLIDDLDENGYLSSPRAQLLAELKTDECRLDAALSVLHRMDPAGVGAADLRECLLIQAQRLDSPSTVLIRIIEDHLDALAKNQLARLSKTMGITLEAVKEARSLLLTLNPKPGNGYSAYNAIPYIRPDLFIVRFESGFQVILNDYRQPKIEISSYYRTLAEDTGSEAAGYVRDKLGKAEWLVNCLSQRKKTILGCAGAILERQKRFFAQGPGHLAPMTLSDVASDLSLHPSTISRAVSGKYLQCQWGVFGLSDFFSRTVSVSAADQSQDMVVSQLRRLIDEEDPAKPFSDQELTDRLAGLEIAISRRTVAKYREQAGIPAAAGRRKY